MQTAYQQDYTLDNTCLRDIDQPLVRSWYRSHDNKATKATGRRLKPVKAQTIKSSQIQLEHSTHTHTPVQIRPPVQTRLPARALTYPDRAHTYKRVVVVDW